MSRHKDEKYEDYEDEKTEAPEAGRLGGLLRKQLPRRGFLKAAGVMLAASSVVKGRDAPTETGAKIKIGPESAAPLPTSKKYSDVPQTPMAPPPTGTLYVFTPHEAQTVEALTARILPGTPDDPGAKEAGVVYYIDNFLAYNEGLDTSTYRKPPFAQIYEGKELPKNQNEPYQTVWVPAKDIQRYGYQSVLTPRDVYRIGIAALDRYTQGNFDKKFVNLSEDQQDKIIGDLSNNKPANFDDNLAAESFFHNLRRDTITGMFCDPAYGGNRDMVGWKLVGFPGAQRAYTPREYQQEGLALRRPPQSMAQMMSFNPGQHANDNVILPVSGRDQQNGEGP